jgi:hypothetical protein
MKRAGFMSLAARPTTKSAMRSYLDVIRTTAAAADQRLLAGNPFYKPLFGAKGKLTLDGGARVYALAQLRWRR